MKTKIFIIAVAFSIVSCTKHEMILETSANPEITERLQSSSSSRLDRCLYEKVL